MQSAWYVKMEFNNNTHTHTHTHILAMAPSGGYPDLDDFANVSEDELARWSKTQVLRACFAFDLVAEGAEGDVEKLRDRLL